MPIVRELVARDSGTHIERVTAASQAGAWGAVHVALDWRCVLPGKGQVHWRSGEESLYVDALTAFRLAPGEAYQLRHEGARQHLVLCSGAAPMTASPYRAWLLRPRELFQVQRSLTQLRRGDVLDVTLAAEASRAALTRAFPLPCASHPTPFLQARHRLASNSHENLKLEELAEEARCSPFHLIRLFSRHVGTTPHQYRLDLRLATALTRLHDARVSLADLAIELGFSSQSHFGEVFRQAVGISPGQARAALRAGFR